MGLTDFLKGNRDDPESLRADLAALSEKEEAERAHLAKLREERTDAVEASLTGDEKAEARLTKLSERMRAVDDRIADFQRLRARLEDRLAVAEAARAKADHARALHRLKILAGRREKQLAEVDLHIELAAKAYRAAEDLGRDMIDAAPRRRSLANTLFAPLRVQGAVLDTLRASGIIPDDRPWKQPVPTLEEAGKDAHAEFLASQKPGTGAVVPAKVSADG